MSPLTYKSWFIGPKMSWVCCSNVIFKMSELCHKNVTDMYLFFGLLLFTSLCKHCGELSSSSRQVNNHPIYTYVPQVLNNVLKDDRRAIEFRFVNTLNMVNNGHREIVLVLAIKFLSAPKHPGI